MNGSSASRSDASGPPPAVQLSDRTLASWEIASVASSVVIAEWTLASAESSSKLVAIPLALVVLLVIVSHRVRRETLRDIGFRFDNFFRALYLLAVPLVMAAGLALLIAWMTGSPINFLRWRPNRNLAIQLMLGFFWALAQQYVLQGFFNRRATLVFGRGWLSVLTVGAIFALLHLPNPWITLITFLAGAIWAAVYQRAPNLIALAVTHVVMTWFTVSTLPLEAFRQWRVGLRYFG